MSVHELEGIALRLSASGKGILAADESQATLGKRFSALHIEPNPENRRRYRELLLTTPGMEAFINGVILHEETLNQRSQQGLQFPELLEEQGILPGVKVDRGLIPLNPWEKTTEGLDGLAGRLVIYKNLGARFAKWRAVFTISDTLPSSLAQVANAQALARYASICQDHGVVPIVEPELLMDGSHNLERCADATEATLYTVFQELHKHQVLLKCMILKPSMVLSGSDCPQQAGINEVATATLEVLRRTVPAAVPSINFLSGGQTPELATAHLNAMNRLSATQRPWQLSFSYGRALQAPALKIWGGSADNVRAAQHALYKRAQLNAAACQGRYRYQSSSETEEEEAEPAMT